MQGPILSEDSIALVLKRSSPHDPRSTTSIRCTTSSMAMPRCCSSAWWRAQTLLGMRRSSVFRIPPRAAVEADCYEAASAAARAGCGKGLSKQAFALFPKILELRFAD
jgi:predicted RNase H-like nuclease